MRLSTHPVLIGAFTAALLVALGGGAWIGWRPAGGTDQPVLEDALPLPPPPIRLSDDPEYDRCLSMLADDPEGSAAMAEAWSGGGEAARHCGALALLALGEAERAAPRLEEIGRASQAGPTARAAVFGQASQAWMIAGAPQRAYGAVTVALSLSPDDSDLLIDRAVASGVLGRHAEAIADLDRVLSMETDRVDALVFRAAAWRAVDRADAAMADVTRAIGLDPDNAEAYLERGILNQMRGNTAAARTDWEKAIDLSPDSPTADLAAQNILLNEAGPRRN